MLADCKYPSVKSTSSSKSKICTHRFWIFSKLESLSKNVCKQTGKVLEKERALFLEMAKNFTQRAFLRLCIIRLKVHFFVEKKSSKTYPKITFGLDAKNYLWINQLNCLKPTFWWPKLFFGIQKLLFWHPKTVFWQLNWLIWKWFWSSNPKFGFGQLLDDFFSTKRCTFRLKTCLKPALKKGSIV